MANNKKVRDEYGGVDAWNELYEYVEHTILKCKEGMKMQRIYVLRLEGLSKGNFIANNNVEPMAKYQYKDILTAFKVANIMMEKKTDFKNEQHRFNFAMLIVEKKINDIVSARLRKEESAESVTKIDIGNQQNEKAGYKSKTQQYKENDIINQLW